MTRDHGDHVDVRPVGPRELGRDPGRGQRLDRPRGRRGRLHVLHARAGATAARSTSSRRRSPRRWRRASTYAESAGVTLAIEPSLRTDVSFVHTLRDGTRRRRARRHRRDRRLGNCWMERDYRGRRSAVPAHRLAVVPVRRRGVRHVRAAVARRPGRARRRRPRDRRVPPTPRSTPGYTGAFELEIVGPDDRGRGSRRRAATRGRTHQRAAGRGAPVSRAIVFNGDETWEERDLPVPDPQARWRGVARRGHRAVSQRLRPLPRSGAHPLRRRVSRRSPATRSSGGSRPSLRKPPPSGGLPKVTGWRCANLVVTPEGFRIYGHDFSVDEGSGLYGGFAEHLELLPGSAVFRLRDDLPAEELTIFEPLSCAVTWVHPVRAGRRRGHRGPRPHGHGHHRGRARRRRVAR